MKPENLQLQIQAMAVMVRVSGMDAENTSRTLKGQELAYTEEDFECEAQRLDQFVQEVIF